MDESKEYIKQCDHPLIQDGWEPQVGDWFKYRNGQDIDVWCGNPGSIYNKNMETEGLIYLPRQDQLWAMLPHKKYVDWTLERDCMVDNYTWTLHRYEQPDDESQFSAPTAEQALIRGVMYELHQKEWTGEKWEPATP